jgi:hypothetical protein
MKYRIRGTFIVTPIRCLYSENHRSTKTDLGLEVLTLRHYSFASFYLRTCLERLINVTRVYIIILNEVFLYTRINYPRFYARCITSYP